VLQGRVVTPQCCTGEKASRRLARRLSGTAASLIPGAVLVLLPKCPLCLAAWLTVITGTAVSATVAAHVRGLIVVVWLTAVALTAALLLMRRLRAGGALHRSDRIGAR
jgi:hypothetical protein